MRLGIFAKTFSNYTGLDAIFSTVHQYNIPGVHFNMACAGLSELPLKIPSKTISEISTLAKNYQLEVIGLSATFNMIDRDPGVVENGLRSLEVMAASVKDLGADFISLCTGSRHADKWTWHRDNATRQAWAEMTATMDKALEIADRHKIYLGVEPEMGNVVRDPRLARTLLNEMDSDRLKIILDPANLFEYAANRQQVRDLISDAIDQLHPYIQVAHAKDRALDGSIRPAGKGDVDYPFFVDQLNQIDFSGPLVLHGLEPQQVSQSAGFLKSLF